MANDTQSSSPILKYNPQLDGLRFCAVFFVICYHWLPSISEIEESFFFGGLVNFFFVLSSYLITTILFSAKEKGMKTGVARYKVMLVFLFRRTIRIFPAFYFFLLVVFMLPSIGNDVRENAGMYFSYLSNYQVFYSGTWPVVTSHIWTLAVEEQLYLLWPLLILFLPYRHLLKTLIAIIVASTIYKAATFTSTPGIPQDILTQYCVDAFAVGALLAYKYTRSEKERRTISKYINMIVYIGIPFGILVIFTKSYYFSFVFNRLLFALVSMKVIEGAVLGYKNYLGSFLENKVVLYLGRISYGIYLYHLLVPVLFWKLYIVAYSYLKAHNASFFATHQKGINSLESVLSSEAGCFIIYAICTVTLAVLSWNLIEKPFNSLKILVNYNQRKAELNRLKEAIS